jgi:hypothetical protein
MADPYIQSVVQDASRIGHGGHDAGNAGKRHYYDGNASKW